MTERRRRTRRLVLAALAAVAVAALLVPLAMYPVINDISTDRDAAPRYLVAPPADPAYDAAALRAPTERAYADLRNLVLPQAPPEVFAAVAALVEERGWQEAARAPGTAQTPWRLQAVAVTRLLRFRDDVMVEVRPAPDGGSIVAMRSKSRVGRGDMGANARRIRAFLDDLRARLGAPAPTAG